MKRNNGDFIKSIGVWIVWEKRPWKTKDDVEKAGGYQVEETGLKKKMPSTDSSGAMLKRNFRGS